MFVFRCSESIPNTEWRIYLQCLFALQCQHRVPQRFLQVALFTSRIDFRGRKAREATSKCNERGVEANLFFGSKAATSGANCTNKKWIEYWLLVTYNWLYKMIHYMGMAHTHKKKGEAGMHNAQVAYFRH